MDLILSLLTITGLVLDQVLSPIAIFIAAWAAVIVVLIMVAVVVGLITHTIDDPEAAKGG